MEGISKLDKALKRIDELEATLCYLRHAGLEFEDTGVAVIALPAWRLALEQLGNKLGPAQV